MKKLLLAFMVLFCAAVVYILVGLGMRAFEEEGSPSHLRRIVAQINARAPQEAGEGVELIGAEMGDRLLTIQYRLSDMTASEIDSIELRALRETMRKYSCSNDAFRELLEKGVTLRYVVVDAEDVQILTSDIMQWECGSFSSPSSR